MIRRLVLVTALAGCLLEPTPAAAQADPMQAALDWLRVQQQPDGGFSNGFSPGSDPGTTADCVLAIRAAGSDPTQWLKDGMHPLDSLQAAIAGGAVAGAGGYAKTALAVQAADSDVHNFGGADLTALVLDDYDAARGLFGGGPFDSALAIQALVAAKVALPAGALDGLLATRLSDGSFAFNGDLTPGAGDSNTTAMVVLALMAAGQRDAVAPSLAYFRAVQNEDGGWTYQKPSAFGEATDANSTALVIQALAAVGEDLTAWRNPSSALLALQQTSGAFAFSAATPGDNLLATVQAIPALAVTTDRTAATPRPLLGVLGAALLLAAILVAVALRRRTVG